MISWKHFLRTRNSTGYRFLCSRQHLRGLIAHLSLDKMPKRKIGSVSTNLVKAFDAPIEPSPKRRSKRQSAKETIRNITNPELNKNVIDAPNAMRASPSAAPDDVAFVKEEEEAEYNVENESLPSLTKSQDSESELSDLTEYSDNETSSKKSDSRKRSNETLKKKVTSIKSKDNKSKDNKSKEQFLDPEAEDDMKIDDEEIAEAVSRPPPVNSDILPLPWKGRLGYACLNTYLRYSNPPVFASRTCRIASILENRHPLKFPDQPPHPTKNRPDKEQPASVERGQRFVESLGIANASDCIKMLEWNDRYGIKFLRLSSEMFPFASHEEFGYKVAPFAGDVLAEVGRTASRLGHRLTTHPGQFTQLGSPRKIVIDNAIRDLEYHSELLSLLKLPPQQDRDAVMILHLGGVFGDKAETIQRFRKNYARLSEDIKKRLVLENDDVSYSVHDLLPVCEELNIPMVLDFHHHNIVFDADKIREGTGDIVDLFPRIIATWRKKNITPKMHYSEPTPAATTPRQRRKHNPRVATLPPCPKDMDLMIEAKDKEQAVFELMRTFKLPGYDRINDIIPHVRNDENKLQRSARGKKAEHAEHVEKSSEIPPEDVGMGGFEGRVYWPPGMEEWLRPKKRVVNKKEETSKKGQPRKKVKNVREEPNISKTNVFEGE